jgi:hypothetical protein
VPWSWRVRLCSSLVRGIEGYPALEIRDAPIGRGGGDADLFAAILDRIVRSAIPPPSQMSALSTDPGRGATMLTGKVCPINTAKAQEYIAGGATRLVRHRKSAPKWKTRPGFLHQSLDKGAPW